ncbi:hypothetical protein GCM10015536_53510 [Streptomyces griseomycini]|nr:hypothetical protein GCM10015536_53510 [Streptomyces griseomycini]
MRYGAWLFLREKGRQTTGEGRGRGTTGPRAARKLMNRPVGGNSPRERGELPVSWPDLRPPGGDGTTGPSAIKPPSSGVRSVRDGTAGTGHTAGGPPGRSAGRGHPRTGPHKESTREEALPRTILV